MTDDASKSSPVVSVRFSEAELGLIRDAAGDRPVSHFIRAAAVRAAQRRVTSARGPLGVSSPATTTSTLFVTNAQAWSGPHTSALQLSVSPQESAPSR